MYSRNTRRDGRDGLTEEEREIARYGLPPKYDGTRFVRGAPPEREQKTAADRYGTDDETGIVPSPPRAAEDPDDRGRIEKLVEGLGEKLGGEEFFILALILLLSGSGDGCEDASDVIVLLVLLLLVGK